MTEIATVQRIIVSVTNIDAALGLYVGVLGLEIRHRSPGFAWLKTGDDVELMLHERPAVPSDTAVAVGFAISALDDKVARCVAVGGSVVDAPEKREWGERMAVIRDVDGHLVCLSERG
ncbi:VOC family protein [Jongsikchunia kroppenstedtii]|uniref:VOC family protein n=1 Tax=Jongsikchunia kroppenstedtii TaxID=1121721 RepID=UPI000370EA82|nr:VOC family protein [Jongsikchunia kroppenstedtii]